MITRSFANNFEVSDYTQELITIPNTWGTLQQLGIFQSVPVAENTVIVEEINNSGADLLFVALGAPKQEKWLSKFQDILKPSLLMGIGGSFDVVAGKMERAPKWMQDASLEWLFRLYKQPSRLGRMLVLPKFVIKVLRIKSYKAS